MSRRKDRSESAGAATSADIVTSPGAARPPGAGRPWWRRVVHRSRHMPLRLKLVLLMCAVVSGALVSTGFAATTLLRHSLMNRVDSQLTTESPQQVAFLAGRGRRRRSPLPGRTPAGPPDTKPVRTRVLLDLERHHGHRGDGNTAAASERLLGADE